MVPTAPIMTTVYSRDDGGWYVEIYDRKTGVEMHVTKIHRTRDAAEKAADDWLTKHQPR